jgi:hypothetical protein
MANTHEHLEHAEHDAHNAIDPFNQRVAVSMAIVAAILAAISMVGHRTHNRVLQLQGDANRLLGDVNRVLGEANRVSTEAAAAEVEKSNLFAWYQAKRQRQAQYQSYPELAALLNPELGNAAEEAARKAKEAWAKKRQEPKDPAAPPGDKKKQRPPTLESWADKVEEYNDPNDPDSLPNINDRGKAAGKKAEELKAEANKVRAEATKFKQQAEDKGHEAEHVHHMTDRFDIAHLAAEIGLVLCSIALLTKKKAYWYLGILAAAVAIGLTFSAYAIPHDKHEPKTEAHSHP